MNTLSIMPLVNEPDSLSWYMVLPPVSKDPESVVVKIAVDLASFCELDAIEFLKRASRLSFRPGFLFLLNKECNFIKFGLTFKFAAIKLNLFVNCNTNKPHITHSTTDA